LSLAFAAVLARLRQWYWIVTLAAALVGGMLVNVVLKASYERLRPHFEDPLLVLTSYSFPSGHAAGATLFYGVLAAFLVSRTYDWRRRAAAVAGAIVAVLLVAFSRMFLGAHYLSVVLAALCASTLWLVLSLSAGLAVAPARGRRDLRVRLGSRRRAARGRRLGARRLDAIALRTAALDRAAGAREPHLQGGGPRGGQGATQGRAAPSHDPGDPLRPEELSPRPHARAARSLHGGDARRRAARSRGEGLSRRRRARRARAGRRAQLDALCARHRGIRDAELPRRPQGAREARALAAEAVRHAHVDELRLAARERLAQR